MSRPPRCRDHLGILVPDPSNHEVGHMKSNPKSSILWFKLNKSSINFQSHSRLILTLVYSIRGIMPIWGNWTQTSQILGRETRKVNQSLQLHISHQMRPYARAKSFRGRLSYICMRVLGALWAISINKAKNEAIQSMWNNVWNNPVFNPNFTLNKALLNCKGHAKVLI